MADDQLGSGTPEDASPRKPPIFLLLIPAIGNSMIWGALSFIQFHARLPVEDGGFGLTTVEVGIIWGLTAVLSALVSPFWGAVSDRTRTRWGKRKPFMVILAPLTAFLLWITVAVDAVFGLQGIFWTLLMFFSLYKITHAGANIPYSTVIIEVVPPKDRVSVSQLSALMNGVGMAMGAVIPTLLFGVFVRFDAPFIVMGISLVVAYLGILPLIPESTYEVEPPKIFHSIKTTFGDRNFLKFQIAQFLWSTGLNIVLFILPFLAQDILGIKEEAGYGVIFVNFLLIAGVFLFLEGWLVEKYNVSKKTAMMFSLIFTCVALPFLGILNSPLLAGIPLTSQVYLMGSLAFIGLIGLMIFPYAILMALVDRERGSESTYNGVNGLIVALAQIPAGPVGGYLLYRFGYGWIGLFCALFMIGAAIIFAKTHIPEHLFQDSQNPSEESDNILIPPEDPDNAP